MSSSYSYVFLGLSITSSWGNGHATTYRALVRALAARGHRVLFLERDLPFYAENRDRGALPSGMTAVYGSLEELKDRFATAVREADLVVVGSFVPEGAAVGDWVQGEARGRTAFYDIDTPVTLRKLERGEHDYLAPALIPRYDLYLSFTGGPILSRLERCHGAPRARPLYCAVDPDIHYPEPAAALWDLGYLGTYSEDRQPALEQLLIEPARRLSRSSFAVAGPQYPGDIEWPENVSRAEHLPPDAHRSFYSAQRFTLNLTRRDMAEAGFSPSVRLFEAAACGVPIVSDAWPGIETFFCPGEEILLASSTEEVIRLLCEMPESARLSIGRRARLRTLAEHTADHRAEALERYTREVLDAGGDAGSRRRAGRGGEAERRAGVQQGRFSDG
jgi:spore maturation protein CgeB